MPINDIKIRALKPREKAYRVADGGGLMVEVATSGSKLWRLSYRFDGKQKMLALGSYPETSLARARERRAEAKALLQAGVDPGASQRAAKEAAALARSQTFGAVAEELIAKNVREGRADPTLKKKRWLLSLLGPEFIDRPVRAIKASDVLARLRVVEDAGNYETARRLRAFTGQVFRFAIATDRAETDPSSALRGALTAPRVEHRAAVTDWSALAGMVRAIWSYQGTPETRTALQLMLLLYPRPGELRLAHWSEFDLDRKTWTIPATRAKMRREHVKPLPDEAVSLLRDLRLLNPSDTLAFPSAVSKDRPISENTLNGALRRLGYAKHEATAHGFRATASTLLNESGLWNPDAIEAELAHVGADEVRRAYHRASYWAERVRMAAWWAQRVCELR
jgi:integrase